MEARHLLARERKRYPDQSQTLVLFTDGRIRDRVEGLVPRCHCIVVDLEGGMVRLGRSKAIARALDADYIHLDTLPLQKSVGG